MKLSKNSDEFLLTSQEFLSADNSINYETVNEYCGFDKKTLYSVLDELVQFGYIEFGYMGLGQNYRYEYQKEFFLTDKGKNYS